MFNPANSSDLRRGVKFVEAKPEVPQPPPKAVPKGPREEAHRERMVSRLQNPDFFEFAVDMTDFGVVADFHRFNNHPRMVLKYDKDWTGEGGQPQYDESLPYPRPTTIREPIMAVDRGGSRAGLGFDPLKTSELIGEQGGEDEDEEFRKNRKRRSEREMKDWSQVLKGEDKWEEGAEENDEMEKDW
jgi:hypothetical protein